MEETKARLKLTEILVKALQQGLTLDDIKRLFKVHVNFVAQKPCRKDSSKIMM